MQITDDMINDAAFAYDEVVYPDDKGTQNALHRATETTHQDAIRAALTAALGDVDPLEDVIAGVFGLTIDEIHMVRPGEWRSYVTHPEPGRRGIHCAPIEGTGPNIDAAIRAAVDNAKGRAS